MTGGCNVRVWLADVDALAVDETHVESLLCRQEKVRAQRFAFEVLRRRYRVSRAALRTVLGHSTSRRPADLNFSYLPYGKPVLDDGPQFNASHSGPMLLIVVGERAPLGIDIEVCRDLGDMDKLCQSYFSETEQAALNLLAGDDWLRGFYRIWTRKEAVIKALGLGLNLDLKSFSVRLDKLDVNDAVKVDSEPCASRRYFVRPLEASRDCEAAIASTVPVILKCVHRIGDGLHWDPLSAE